MSFGHEGIERMIEEKYYVQNGFIGNCMCFWAKNDKGYTCHLDNAETYTKEQALSRCRQENNEKAWPVSAIQSGASSMVDHQKVPHELHITPDYPPIKKAQQPQCEACGKFTPRNGNPYVCPHCDAGV